MLDGATTQNAVLYYKTLKENQRLASNNEASTLMQQTVDEMAADFHALLSFSEQANQRVKYAENNDHVRLSRGNMLAITKSNRQQEKYRYAFLETGNERSGLYHIIFKHGEEFINKGIRLVDLPGLLLNAASHPSDEYLYRQGRKGANPRVVYAVCNPLNNEAIGVALSIGTNGYIVGANVADISDKSLAKYQNTEKSNNKNLEQLKSTRENQLNYSRTKFAKHGYGFKL